MSAWRYCLVAAGLALVTSCASARAGNSEVILFYEGQFDLRIPAGPDDSKGWMDDAVLVVPGHFTIEDLDVSVTILHTSVFDLQLSVESPSGTVVLLNMYDPFTGYFEGADYSGTTFDDEAQVPIQEAAPPFPGHFQPLAPNALSAFDGEDAFGSWKLRVYDCFYGDTGRLVSFGLTITIPESATLSILLTGVGLLAMPILRQR
jgi:hypothetical protein